MATLGRAKALNSECCQTRADHALTNDVKDRVTSQMLEASDSQVEHTLNQKAVRPPSLVSVNWLEVSICNPPSCGEVGFHRNSVGPEMWYPPHLMTSIAV